MRNRNPAATAPALPPAPTMPATAPSAFWLMKGTTEKVAPSAICTNRLNTSIAAMATGRMSIREKIARAMPSSSSTPPRNSVRPPQPEADAHLVAHDTSEGAGKEVHQSEQPGNQPRQPHTQAEAVVVVEGGDVVHRQLDAEAGPVNEEQRPDTVVLGRFEEGASPGAGRLFGPFCCSLFRGGVLGELEVGDAHEEEGDGRRHHGDAPADDVGGPEGDDYAQHQRHGHLGDAAAHVAPAGGRGVGRSHHVGREHHRGVVLRDDEGSPDNADGQPEEQERLVVGGQTYAHHWDRANDQQPRIGDAGADAVAQPAHHQPGHDGHGDRGDDGVADFSLGQLKVVADERHHRRDAEPAEEGQEEGHPAHVEHPHMRTPEAEEPDAGCLVRLWVHPNIHH